MTLAITAVILLTITLAVTVWEVRNVRQLLGWFTEWRAGLIALADHVQANVPGPLPKEVRRLMTEHTRGNHRAK